MTDKTMTDDELLSAYLDDELDTEVADEVTIRLASEPALMQRLEALRQADGAVDRVFRAIDDTPIPDDVMKLFDAAPVARADNVVAFPRRSVRRFFEAPVAIAASVALIAGFITARILDVGTAPDSTSLTAGTVDRGTALHALLERAASGESLAFGDRAAGTVVLTFRDGDGDYCRQVRVDLPGRAAHGLACRRGGGWEMDTIALGNAAPAGQFGQAAADVPPAVSLAVDEQIKGGSALDLESEKTLISDSWENPEN